MERVKSAAIRLRDTGQWKAQVYGHAIILQHDKSIPRKTDLRKSLKYCQTTFDSRQRGMGAGPTGQTDAICFYTDGSKLEGHFGGGVYSEQLNIRKSFRLPDFQAEVHAIKEAQNCLGNISPQRGNRNIYSDSQAGIKSIYSTSRNSRTIADCHRSLHEMASQFTFCLIWVPGHRDIVATA